MRDLEFSCNQNIWIFVRAQTLMDVSCCQEYFMYFKQTFQTNTHFLSMEKNTTVPGKNGIVSLIGPHNYFLLKFAVNTFQKLLKV